MDKLKKIVLIAVAAALCVAAASCGKKEKKSALEEASTSEAQTKILEEAKSQSKLDEDDEDIADTDSEQTDKNTTSKTEEKDTSVSTIGGADAPTDIKVSDKNTAAAPAQADFGEVAYQSEVVGVKFSLPEGYQMESDEVIKHNNEQIAASAEESQRHMRYEAIIQNPAENIQVIVCVDGNKGDFDEMKYLSGVAANYEKATNAVIDRTAVYATIAGQEYTTMKISMNSGNILYCVRKQGDSIIGFIISSPEGADDKVATVMNSFRPY